MIVPITFARGFTTGAQLLAALEQRAGELGLPLTDYVRPLTPKPADFIRIMRRSQQPVRLTFDRVEALLGGAPIPPAQTKSPAHPHLDKDSGRMPDRVDRDPCRYCGTRGDIGCKHQIAAR